jgi:hypothetical protein
MKFEVVLYTYALAQLPTDADEFRKLVSQILAEPSGLVQNVRYRTNETFVDTAIFETKLGEFKVPVPSQIIITLDGYIYWRELYEENFD